MLRLVGTHPRQVRRMMRVETAIVVLAAVAVGLLSALPPLVGISLGLTEPPIPSVSPTALAGIVGVAVLLGWSSIMVPTGVVMRARPVDAIGVREYLGFHSRAPEAKVEDDGGGEAVHRRLLAVLAYLSG